MSIPFSVVKNARYFPELIPAGNFYNNIPSGEAASPTPIDIRNLNSKSLELHHVAVDSKDGLRMEMKFDGHEHSLRTRALTNGLWYDFAFAARSEVFFSLLNEGPVDRIDVRVDYSAWIDEPNAAQKLLMGWELSNEEQSFVDAFGVRSSFEKGILPLPRSIVLERQYNLLSRTTQVAANVDVPANTSKREIFRFTPKADEFIVLEGFEVHSDPDDAIELFISRDGDNEYVRFDTTWMHNAPKCFIPALHEMRIEVNAPATVNGVDFTAQVGRYKLNNVLRARWGLVSPDEIPGDVWAKVKAGVL